MAVVNDTTGTLMSCAHKNRGCGVGLIVGQLIFIKKTKQKKNLGKLIESVVVLNLFRNWI